MVANNLKQKKILLSRKQFLKFALAAGGLLLAKKHIIEALKHFNNKDKEHITRFLEANIGHIYLSEEVIHYFSQDFSNYFRKKPLLVIFPKSENDLLEILRIVQELKIPFSIRGSGHSCFGQSLNENGIIIHNQISSHKHRLASIDLETKSAYLSTGAQWFDIEKILNIKSFKMPVLPDYLYLSVGGTLSVGGIGRTSHLHSTQVHKIQSLNLINFKGEKIHCSQMKNSSLFFNALCGQGKYGFITDVKSKILPLSFKLYYINYFKLANSDELFDFIAYYISQKKILKQIASFCIYSEKNHFIAELQSKEKIRSKWQSFAVKKTSETLYPFIVHKEIMAYNTKVKDYYHLWQDNIFQLNSFKSYLTYILKNKSKTYFFCDIYILILKNQKDSQIAQAPNSNFEEDYVISCGTYYNLTKNATNNQKNDLIKILNNNQDIAKFLQAKLYLYSFDAKNL